MNKKIAAAAVITAMTMLTACGEAAPAETTDTEAASVTLSETSAESTDTTTETSVETDELTETEPEISESETKNDSEVTNAEYSPEELGFDELEEPILDDIEELEICDWENINYDTTYYVTVDDTEQHTYTESYHFSDDNLETEFSSKVKNDTILQYFKDNSGMFAELCKYDGPSGCYIAVTEHDLDNDGTNEMLINVNYGVTGTVGYPGDFAIVDDNAVVYWSKDDMNTTMNRQNMGMYFTEDPFSTCGFNDVCAYPSIAEYDFSVNADNCFIGCEISNNSVLNSYYQVTSEDGVYSVNCIKTIGWMQKSDEDANYWREFYSVEE